MQSAADFPGRALTGLCCNIMGVLCSLPDVAGQCVLKTSVLSAVAMPLCCDTVNVLCKL